LASSRIVRTALLLCDMFRIPPKIYDAPQAWRQEQVRSLSTVK
jgi:hypothetical protein